MIRRTTPMTYKHFGMYQTPLVADMVEDDLQYVIHIRLSHKDDLYTAEMQRRMFTLLQPNTSYSI